MGFVQEQGSVAVSEPILHHLELGSKVFSVFKSAWTELHNSHYILFSYSVPFRLKHSLLG